MSRLKILFIGGGSFAWTPRMAGNILLNDWLDGSQIMLYDVRSEPLELTHAVCLKYKQIAGSKTEIVKTTDRAVAMDGADAAIVTITTGGLEAMKHDIEIPEKYGIHQTVGDTTGPGGLARALRNIPVFLDLARSMERQCPRAWMLNCSNPLAVLTRAVNRVTSIRCLGVCHGVVHTVHAYAEFFKTKAADCSYVNTGIDHCSWFTSFVVNGAEAVDLLEKGDIGKWLSVPPQEAKADEKFGPLYGLRVSLRVGMNLGVIPAIGDRHILEFLPGYLSQGDPESRHGVARTSIAAREEGATEARKRLERIASGEATVSLSPSSDRLDAWITALHRGQEVQDNVNAPNTGQIPQLPHGAVVETRGVIDAAGVHPLVSPMPPALEALIRPRAIGEEMSLDAALDRDFDKALAALTMDPQVPNADVARPLLEELLAANSRWLPQFTK